MTPSGEREEPPQDLTGSEDARVKRRDRKRQTRMVVDNAQVKRVLPAIQQRRTERTKKSPSAGSE